MSPGAMEAKQLEFVAPASESWDLGRKVFEGLMTAEEAAEQLSDKFGIVTFGRLSTVSLKSSCDIASMFTECMPTLQCMMMGPEGEDPLARRLRRLLQDVQEKDKDDPRVTALTLGPIVQNGTELSQGGGSFSMQNVTELDEEGSFAPSPGTAESGGPDSMFPEDLVKTCSELSCVQESIETCMPSSVEEDFSMGMVGSAVFTMGSGDGSVVETLVMVLEATGRLEAVCSGECARALQACPAPGIAESLAAMQAMCGSSTGSGDAPEDEAGSGGSAGEDGGASGAPGTDDEGDGGAGSPDDTADRGVDENGDSTSTIPPSATDTREPAGPVAADESRCNLSPGQRWCAIHRQCVQDWTTVGCDFACPGRAGPGGWALASAADSRRVNEADVHAALESLARGGEAYDVEFSCVQEVSGALAGSFSYAVVDMQAGDMIYATVYQKAGTCVHDMMQISEGQ